MKSAMFEAIVAQATRPNTGAAASIAPNSGTTQLSARSSPGRVNIFQLWAFLQATGFSQPVWNSGHDAIRNYRVAVNATNPFHQKPFNQDLLCNPNEDFTITIGGSNVAGEVESFVMIAEYEELGGDTGMLTTVEMELVGSAAGWTGSTALTATSALLKAGMDYAVLGITTDTACAAIGLQGPGTGNYRTACPGGTVQTEMQAQWFLRAAALGDRAAIPVINADDAKSTLLSFVQNQTNISPNVTLFLAALKK
jgi:hypothetical protein